MLDRALQHREVPAVAEVRRTVSDESGSRFKNDLAGHEAIR